MTTIWKLREYEDSEWPLSEEDYEFLSHELGSQISSRQELRDNRRICVVNPNQFVGVVSLPSGLLLEIYPKIPVRNLFLMLSRVFGFEPFRDETTQLERIDELLAIIAQQFAGLLEERIDHGLYRDYVEKDENLNFVRGRIVFAEDLRRNALARHRTWCRYADFTWDIPENQILRQVAHLVSGWGFGSNLSLRLSRLDGIMGEVTPTALPASVIPNFRYNRLNEDYRSVHQLCRLFLEGSSLNERLGVWDSKTFLVDMNRLFEEFVTCILQSKTRSGFTVLDQSEIMLAEDRRLPVRPDLLFEGGGVPLLVADCKYKSFASVDKQPHDIYQVLAYCIAANVTRGVLIYPSYELQADDFFNIRHLGIVIERCTINLSLPMDDFEEECDRFKSSMFRRAEEKAAELCERAEVQQPPGVSVYTLTSGVPCTRDA